MQEIQSASLLLSIWGQEISGSQENKIHTQPNNKICTHLRTHKCPEIIGCFLKLVWDSSWRVGRTSWPFSYQLFTSHLQEGKTSGHREQCNTDIFHSLTTDICLSALFLRWKALFVLYIHRL